MALIRGIFPAVLALLFIPPAFSQGEKAAPAPLAAEIESIEKQLAGSKLSPAERREALGREARLFELSGDTEEAAQAWNKAAWAVPGGPGFNALIRSALCLAAQGEFDRAGAALRPVLAAEDPRLAARARFLLVQIEAFKTGGTGELYLLLEDRDCAEWKPAAYYTIWKISGETSARNRLMAEFPQSPEARAAAEPSGSARISALPSPLWLFRGIQAAPGALAAGLSEPSAPPVSGAGRSPDTAPAARGPSALQTGSFEWKENAAAWAERLRKAGFKPVVTQKMMNGKILWVVGVEPGIDPDQTTLLLKDKGFESFPVY
ncbi:MAG: SPOR domain-containing protein [Treponema sp.]|jgi:tetratricopeptide (TPR) repeat protein|nr:SPOR domain-containing protein [Treponema sp.]